MIVKVANAKKVWELYANSWGVESAQEKTALYEQCLEAGCMYTDPTIRVSGWDDLMAYMLDFHKQIPGGHFVTTDFLAHHDCCLANWEMRAGNGDIAGTGISFAQFSENGKLKSMTGFFDASKL